MLGSWVVAGEAKEIRDCVLVPFDVLAGKAMGAGGYDPRQLSCYHLNWAIV
jgi:hypothetical protein